jgi:GNAT superfamily N-acetyltransferase
MAPTVRPLEDRDRDPVVALSLRAWAPVFASMERVLGPSGVFAALYPDWRAEQRRAVEAALAGARMHVWVAEVDGVVAGFVAAILADETVGEVHMVAVDPPLQRRGIATALLDVATAWIAGQGRPVALISTGGDPGHDPARRAYERAGFTALPAVNYFRKL